MAVALLAVAAAAQVPSIRRRQLSSVCRWLAVPGPPSTTLIGSDRTAHGDDAVEKSLGYGADVLAVSDPTVAAIRDDMPEVARVSARVKHGRRTRRGA